MAILKGRSKGGVFNTHSRRRESNEEVIARFEREAHNRERADIQITVDVFNKWVNVNSMRSLM